MCSKIFVFFFLHMIPVGNQRKEKKKKECISKNGMPANGGILFFEVPTPPKHWRKHSQGNIPSNYTKNLEQVFRNKSNNRVLESVDQEVLGSHLGSHFRFSFRDLVSNRSGYSFVRLLGLCFSVEVCLLCLSRGTDRRNLPVSPSTSRGVFVFLSDLSLQRALWSLHLVTYFCMN